MVKAKIAVNGYGTIGKRVADAVRAQDDMEVIGISKTKPNYEASVAHQLGYEYMHLLRISELLRRQECRQQGLLKK